MKFVVFIIGIMVTFASFAYDCVDSVNVRFRVASSVYDPALGDNRAVMDSFINKVREAVAAGDIESITVYGYASPEGKPKANERLARNRCATIADYITTHAGVSPDLIEQRPGGIGWDELRRLVAAAPDVPHRERVLYILDNTPVWVFDSRGRIVDSRKKQLMDLAGGRPWNWMMAHLYPEIRNAIAISLSRVEQPAAEEATVEEPTAEETAQTIQTGQTSQTSQTSPTSQTSQTGQTDSITPSIPITPITPTTDHTPLYVGALKTNMLYDAALMPNLELEWMINRTWSVALEGNVAWWNKSIEKTYRIAYGSPEVRYHFKQRDFWHGPYVGAFAGGGFYDLCNGKNGYRGPIAMAGLSLGYMWPITSRLSLEAAVGAGYMASPRYKHYKPRDGHKVYFGTHNLHYFGPLKVKLSIAWRFWDIAK